MQLPPLAMLRRRPRRCRLVALERGNFGHSRAVAALARTAGKRMRLPVSDIRELGWAGHAHDIGGLSVPVSTWMRPGPLTARETDAARLRPNNGERALSELGGDGKAVAALCATTSASTAAPIIAASARPTFRRPPAFWPPPKPSRPRGKPGPACPP